MSNPSNPVKRATAGKVLSFAQQQQKRQTLAAFDALGHEDKRAALDRRAAAERAARQKL